MNTERHFAADAETGEILGHTDISKASSEQEPVVSFPNLTNAQRRLLSFLKSQTENGIPRWVYFREIPFRYQSRTVRALVDMGAIEQNGNYGEYRAN